MKTTGRVPGLVLLAIMSLALLGGCSTIDISDISAYDKYYTDSTAERTRGISPKFVFYVPYRQFKISQFATGDTTPILDALKTVFGEAISFEKSNSTSYVVDVKSVEEWKDDGFTAKSRIVADFTAKGKIEELTVEYNMEDRGLSLENVYKLYRAAALDLANQIKNRMGPQL